MKRRTVLLLGAAAVVGGGAGGVGWWTSADTRRRPEDHTDKAAVAKYFPALGPLVKAHWATNRDGEAGGRSLLPSPDLVFTAVLQLQPGKVAGLVAGGGFDVVAAGVHLSSFEKGLSNYLPAGAKWEHSDTFDDEVSSRFDGGRCYLDRATDTAFVRAVNPKGTAAPTPT